MKVAKEIKPSGAAVKNRRPSISRIALLRRADREHRLQTVKALGRIAYRIARDGDLVCVVIRESQKKYLRKRDEGWLSIDWVAPHPRSVDHTDFSEIEVRADDRKVLEIRWNSVGLFKAVLYEPGVWEQELLDWPDPVPFD